MVPVLLCGLVSSASAQSPLPDSFNPGANGTVYAVAVQSDGKVLAGGAFTTMGGQPRNYLSRLNADGTLDGAFNPGADNSVYSMVVQEDGKILLGGRFTAVGGEARMGVARLNADGTLDGSFNPGANSTVKSMVVQEDGKILLGGFFTTVGGEDRIEIARLNADGTLDGAFNPGANRQVNSLALQADGKILVGGFFTTLGGQPRNYIARLNGDGLLDAGFNPAANGLVYSLAVQAEGEILVGGAFTRLGGQARTNIARLNADGTVDMGFNPGANGSVASMAVQADGKILVGGHFTALGGQTRTNFARLNADGSLDQTFNQGANGVVYALAIQDHGAVIVGGQFTAMAGQARSNIARLNPTDPATNTLTFDGSTITWWRGGSTPEVWRATFDYSTNGLLWAPLGACLRVPGGWQMTGLTLPPEASIRARGHVASGLFNGSAWFVETVTGPPVFDTLPSSRTDNFGTTATFRASVGGNAPLFYQWRKDDSALVDGPRIAGVMTSSLILSNVSGADAGDYTVVASNSEGSVTSVPARLTVIDPLITVQAIDQSKQIGESAVFSITAAGSDTLLYNWYKDGVALAQGTNATLTLTSLRPGDAGAYRVAVSNQFGSVTSAVAMLYVNLATLDSAFYVGAGVGGRSLALQADGKILVGGASRIVRLNADGTPDPEFNPVTVIGGVTSLALQTDGKILTGGNFTMMAGQPRTNLARLNADGTLDAAFDPRVDGTVSAQALQADGKIVVGGFFNSLGGQPRTNIARLDANGTPDPSFNPGADSRVFSLSIQADGRIVAGGGFSTLGGQTRSNIARLNIDGTLDTGFNPGANDMVHSVAVQADGKILVGGYFTRLGGQMRTSIGRLNADGTTDVGFHPGASVGVGTLAIQADGKILLGGTFTLMGGQPHAIARLNVDGTLDGGFNPEADGYVVSLGLQADGKILVQGSFTMLTGHSITNFARLNNTEPATQSLTCEGSTVSWQRRGASPEVWRTSFDVSTNGSDWISLGAGTRVPGGWQLADASLPAFGVIRARGHVAGSQDNSSAWFVETQLPLIAILTSDARFGVISNQFGFNLRGVGSQTVMVEGSSNLLQWTSLSTNVMTNGLLYFSDPGWTEMPLRFYRAKLAP